MSYKVLFMQSHQAALMAAMMQGLQQEALNASSLRTLMHLCFAASAWKSNYALWLW
jgi:hypothetical protein